MLAQYMLSSCFCLCVCLWLCVGHADIVSKRLDRGSRKQHRTIALGILKVTGSYVHVESGIISKIVRDRDVITTGH